MKSAFQSFLCATFGWMIGLAAILFGTVKEFYFSPSPVSGWTFGSIISLYAVMMALFIIPTWLFILFPLFLFTSNKAFIWNYIFCPIIGAIIACAITSTLSYIQNPRADFNGLLILSMIVGGASGLCSAFIRTREAHKVEQGAAANP